MRKISSFNNFKESMEFGKDSPCIPTSLDFDLLSRLLWFNNLDAQMPFDVILYIR